MFSSNLITAIGMMSFLPFFPALLRNLGIEDPGQRMAWTGILTGAAPFMAACMGPIWGSIGDRVGRKPMLIRSLLAISIFVGAMGFATSPWQLLALRLGQGLFSGFVPPSITLVSVGAPEAVQGRLTGRLQAALPVGMIAGPFVGAYIQSNLGFGELFAFVSTAATVSALAVARFAHEDPSLRMSLEGFSPTSILSHTARDLGEILRRPAIRRALLTLATAQFAVASTTPQLQLFVEELIGGSAAEVASRTGWLFTAMAVAGVISTPLWGAAGDRFGHAWALAAASLATSLVLGATSLVPVFTLLFAARVVLGCTNPGVGVAAFGLAATNTPDERRGGAMGAIFSVRALSLSFGSMVGGLLAPLLGLRGLFAASALLLAVVVVGTYLARRTR